MVRLEARTGNHRIESSNPTGAKEFVLCSWVRHLTLITLWFESHVKLVVPCWSDNYPDCTLKLQTPSKRVGDHPGSVSLLTIHHVLQDQDLCAWSRIGCCNMKKKKKKKNNNKNWNLYTDTIGSFVVERFIVSDWCRSQATFPILVHYICVCLNFIFNNLTISFCLFSSQASHFDGVVFCPNITSVYAAQNSAGTVKGLFDAWLF